MTPEEPPRPSNLIEVMARALHREAVGREEGWEHVADEIRAALKAAEEAGYVLAPKEPTNRMVERGMEKVGTGRERDIKAIHTWTEMLRAAPKVA